MSKKKPRTKDPHSWIKDTTKKAASLAEKPKAAAAMLSEPDEETAEPQPAPGRFVIVHYHKNDGRIYATQEVRREAQVSAVEPPASVSEDKGAARIGLTGELLEKKLRDIHENYKVVITKKKATLVPKG